MRARMIPRRSSPKTRARGPRRPGRRQRHARTRLPAHRVRAPGHLSGLHGRRRHRVAGGGARRRRADSRPRRLRRARQHGRPDGRVAEGRASLDRTRARRDSRVGGRVAASFSRLLPRSPAPRGSPRRRGGAGGAAGNRRHAGAAHRIGAPKPLPRRRARGVFSVCNGMGRRSRAFRKAPRCSPSRLPCAVNALSYGGHAFSVQFHVELTPTTVSDWGEIPEYAQSPGGPLSARVRCPASTPRRRRTCRTFASLSRTLYRNFMTRAVSPSTANFMDESRIIRSHILVPVTGRRSTLMQHKRLEPGWEWIRKLGFAPGDPCRRHHLHLRG